MHTTYASMKTGSQFDENDENRNKYDHLLNKHTLNKTSENYSGIMKSCTSVLSILTKKKRKYQNHVGRSRICSYLEKNKFDHDEKAKRLILISKLGALRTSMTNSKLKNQAEIYNTKVKDYIMKNYSMESKVYTTPGCVTKKDMQAPPPSGMTPSKSDCEWCAMF